VQRFPPAIFNPALTQPLWQQMGVFPHDLLAFPPYYPGVKIDGPGLDEAGKLKAGELPHGDNFAMVMGQLAGYISFVLLGLGSLEVVRRRWFQLFLCAATSSLPSVLRIRLSRRQRYCSWQAAAPRRLPRADGVGTAARRGRVVLPLGRAHAVVLRPVAALRALGAADSRPPRCASQGRGRDGARTPRLPAVLLPEAGGGHAPLGECSRTVGLGCG